MSVLIKGGTIVTAEQTLRADVLCHDGEIAQIYHSIDKPGECEEIDADGNTLKIGRTYQLEADVVFKAIGQTGAEQMGWLSDRSVRQSSFPVP
jgi:NADPH-dependent glutamate synthase beta subunit-like oxidoreductase